MHWMVPYNQLGERQLHVLDSCLKENNKPYFIHGFAGSGKTVLLLHAISEFRSKNSNGTVCVVVFTHALVDLIKTGIPDHLQNIIVMTVPKFATQNQKCFDLIVVDEIQDVKHSLLQKLKKYSKKLIIAGDENQSIYTNGVSPEDIEQELSPEKLKLDILYRLTQTMRNIVRTILPDSGIENARSGRAAQVQVVLAHANSIRQEIEWIWQQSRLYSKVGEPVVILLPQHWMIAKFVDTICSIESIDSPSWTENKWHKTDYEPINHYLSSNGLQLQYLGSNYGALSDSDGKPVIYLMTYHSAKGLDFETVFMPFLNNDINFGKWDEALRRRMFFVAATRSRKNLFLSYHKQQPHEYVQNMPQNELCLMTCDLSTPDNNNDNDDFFF